MKRKLIYGLALVGLFALVRPAAAHFPWLAITEDGKAVLFFGSQTKTNIKRFIRHPQMLGVILWSVAHLLVNGDSRSVLLFGGMGAWAILEIVFCNLRDGAWQKPGPSPLKWDVATLVIGGIAFAVLVLLHEKLFNVAPYMG